MPLGLLALAFLLTPLALLFLALALGCLAAAFRLGPFPLFRFQLPAFSLSLLPPLAFRLQPALALLGRLAPGFQTALALGLGLPALAFRLGPFLPFRLQALAPFERLAPIDLGLEPGGIDGSGLDDIGWRRHRLHFK